MFAIPGCAKPVVGMVGFAPLPGSFGYDGSSLASIAERAASDAATLQEAGLDGLMIQNVGDLPVPERVGPDTVAFMATLGLLVRQAVGPDFPIGVNVLKNDGLAALAIAHAIGAAFVRVKVYVGAMVGAEGLVQGCARECLEFRRRIGAEKIAILADIHDRTGVPLGAMTLEETAHEAVWFGRADGLVLTGRSLAESLDWHRRVKGGQPGIPCWIGGSVTLANVAEVLPQVDGVIIGTALKFGGDLLQPVDPAAARRFMDRAQAARETKEA